MIYTFDDTIYLKDWDNGKSDDFEIANSELKPKRNQIGNKNIAVGLTLTPVTGTLVENPTYALLDDSASYSRVTSQTPGTGQQQVTIDLASVKQVRRVSVELIQNDESQTYGEVKIYGSYDGINYKEIPTDWAENDNLVIADSSSNYGVDAQYILIDTSGTSIDADEVLISNVRVFQAEYVRPVSWIDSNQYVVHAAGFTGFSITGDCNFQILINDIAMYWNGIAWVTVSINPTQWGTYSNDDTTIDTNISSLTVTGSDRISLRAIFTPTETVTETVTSATLTEA